jgi:2-succinyl-5-enolpyruvyl-6-hydroxy-3-cyclohexene-1-carboxylate synthase
MPATDAYLLLRAFCDELARCGMTDACTSPGSRSAPLVLSLVREPGITCWSHIDERCAGFFAVGLAKASRRPVAIACTSGTAAAELAPAVIEAHHARVPLVVLTADRPPELRDNGAGQAIDQLGLYGTAVKWFFELGTHEATQQRLRWIRALACRVYWTACDASAGPVHINVPLREPLVLDEPLPSDASGRPGRRPWVDRGPAIELDPSQDPVEPASPPVIAPRPRTVIVAGRYEREPRLALALANFAELVGCPLLADPLSGARYGAGAIAHYDALLRDEAFAQAHRPELVIRVGDLPTSKPLRTWLASLVDTEQVLLDPERAWQDPAAAVTTMFDTDPHALLTALAHSHSEAGDDAWLASWTTADDRAARAIHAVLGDDLSEPCVAAELGARLPSETTLFVASSMPIRDVETFFPARMGGPRVLCNRGTNGIDGTVSAAYGAAAAGDSPVVLLIGDVALAYDIGGLLAGRRLGLDLTIVLLNNDGGGIFHFLPVAREHDAFEQHVVTPHGLDFAHAATLYGAAYARVETVEALHAGLERGLVPGSGTTILEVRTDREQNVALHHRIGDAVRDAVAAD